MSNVKFIQETFKLAEKGKGWTNPNPMVGAIIVKNGEIIARGYHKGIGQPHAEIEALKNAKTSVIEATLYVNLEPCSCQGKTPPCVGVIIRSGIKKVVCSTLDPNPQNHGQGITQLKKAGVDVSTGILEEEARELNEAFFTFHEKKRPYIALKYAASLDGKIATKTGDSNWITNEKARTYARKLRGQYQAVLIGINTILKDDPHLGARDKKFKDPIRIILDPTLKIPLSAQVLRDSNVLIVTTKNVNKKKKNQLEEKRIQFINLSDNSIQIPKLLTKLYQKNIISVFVEGGGSVLGSFVDAKLFDKLYAFYAPILISGHDSIPAINGNGVNTIDQSIHLKTTAFKHFDDNFLIVAKPERN